MTSGRLRRLWPAQAPFAASRRPSAPLPHPGAFAKAASCSFAQPFLHAAPADALSQAAALALAPPSTSAALFYSNPPPPLRISGPRIDSRPGTSLRLNPLHPLSLLKTSRSKPPGRRRISVARALHPSNPPAAQAARTRTAQPAALATLACGACQLSAVPLPGHQQASAALPSRKADATACAWMPKPARVPPPALWSTPSPCLPTEPSRPRPSCRSPLHPAHLEPAL